MKSKASLFDTSSRSLSKKQLEEAFDMFTKFANTMTIGPQTVYGIEKGVHSIRFVPKSSSYTVSKPSVIMEMVESCQSLENLKSIQVSANNCGVCRNGGVAKFDNRNIVKLEQVLLNASDLFMKTRLASIEEDKVQLQFQKKIDLAKRILRAREVKDKHGYKEASYLGKVNGELDEQRSNQTFGIELKGLSIEQIEKLSSVIVSL